LGNDPTTVHATCGPDQVMEPLMGPQQAIGDVRTNLPKGLDMHALHYAIRPVNWQVSAQIEENAGDQCCAGDTQSGHRKKQPGKASVLLEHHLTKTTIPFS
jgi:hypothetical protein